MPQAFWADNTTKRMIRDPSKYDYIDAVRGLAILGVIAVHSSQQVGFTPHALQWLISMGASGVQLFYIASALTLCLSWHARASYESAPVRNFFIRRFFRIAPLFWLAIVLYPFLITGFSASYWAPNGIKWWFLPTTALFLHGFHPEIINSVVPYGWSVAVEMSFYAILPMLLIKLQTIRAQFAFLVATVVLYNVMTTITCRTVLLMYPLDQQYLVSDFMSLNFLAQLPVFAIGLLSYSVLVARYEQKKAMFIGGIATFIAFMILFLVSPSKPRIVPTHVVFGLFFAFFTLALARYPVKLIVNPVVVFMGKISYGMYLSHFAIIHFVLKLHIGCFVLLRRACVAAKTRRRWPEDCPRDVSGWAHPGANVASAWV